MQRYAAIVAAIVLLVALGVRDAVTASRYSELQASGAVQVRLDSIPLDFDGWHGEPMEANAKVMKNASAIAWSKRRYTRGGPKAAEIVVLILAGEPGEIGAHDPERCYGGTGYRPRGGRTRKSINDEGIQHYLWSENFDRETLPAGSIEVAWGWCDAGHWQASEDARWEFTGREILYKIYVLRSIPSAAALPEANDPTVDLMTSMAPLARIALAGAKP